ncbi:MAG: PAC2 family protein, partial [Thermoproteota archaeon]
IGLVGSLTGTLFIELASESSIVSEFYPESLLYVSITSREGLIRIPKILITRVSIKEIGDVLVVRGSSQPTTQINQYDLAKEIVDIAENLKVKLIVGIGGYAISHVDEKRRIYISSSNWQITMIGASLGFLPLSGTVVGAAGLIPGVASLRGLKGVCILVETSGESPDLTAAKIAYNGVLTFLKKILQPGT